MKLTKIFLPFLLLSIFSLCPFLPKQPSEVPTGTAVTRTSPPTAEPITPTTIIATGTATSTDVPAVPTPTATPEVLPSPTPQPLIPANLQAINAENIQNLAVVAEIPYHQLKPNFLIFAMKLSQDGTKLAVRASNWENCDHNLLVWDLISNAPLLDVEDEDPILWGDVYFSQDDNQLWGFREGFFDQYDLQSGELVNSTAVPQYTGSAVALSPDEKTLVTGIYDGITQNSTVYFYEFGSFAPYFSEAIAYGIMSFRFSPDSRMVAGTSAQIGGTITKIWDVETGSMLKDFYNYDYGPTFSADSTLVAFEKGVDFSVLSTGTWVVNHSFQNQNQSSTNYPTFFLAENQILAIKETASVTFNDVNTGKELLELPEQVMVVEYFPKLNIIATNNKGAIKLWGILP